MTRRLFVSALALVLSFTATSTLLAEKIKKDEVDYQNQAFKQWWGIDLEWKLADQPTQGVVPKFRVPYSGFHYPDRSGGTLNAMRKYDAAFNGGRSLATSFENEDITKHGRNRGIIRRPAGPGTFLSRVRMRRNPGWYGHCNGWTAAAIRHAEPQKSVTRNGVTFSPADIKALLAEMYMYCDTEFLGGIDPAINPATMHVIISNWLGRGKHPVGMDTTVGKEVWNYPIYSYAFKATPIDGNKKKQDVWLTVVYADSTQGEPDKAPTLKKHKYFHYSLDLDDDGKVVGGSYFSDSDRIDMLWAALQPVKGGEKGNELGNPHISHKEILAIWRESVPEDIRGKWFNIDPTDEDAIIEPEEQETADTEETPKENSEPKAEDKADEAVDEVAATSEGEADADETVAEPPLESLPEEPALRSASAEEDTDTN